MARNPRRITFETAGDMARHLNAWAATSLTTPEQWADTLVAAQQWLDYSARNQVLLASYGVDGPVAGQETWRLVASTTDSRPCAVRAGEHGWPVRVPVTTGGSEPDPYLGGTRPSRSRTDRFEWRPVFAVDQLARRPAPGALTPVEAPAEPAAPRRLPQPLRHRSPPPAQVAPRRVPRGADLPIRGSRPRAGRAEPRGGLSDDADPAPAGGPTGDRSRLGVDSGSIGLCPVASGATDAFIEFAKGFALWDLLPGQFILESAGGAVCGLDGQHRSPGQPTPSLASIRYARASRPGRYSSPARPPSPRPSQA